MGLYIEPFCSQETLCHRFLQTKENLQGNFLFCVPCRVQNKNWCDRTEHCDQALITVFYCLGWKKQLDNSSTLFKVQCTTLSVLCRNGSIWPQTILHKTCRQLRFLLDIEGSRSLVYVQMHLSSTVMLFDFLSFVLVQINIIFVHFFLKISFSVLTHQTHSI